MRKCSKLLLAGLGVVVALWAITAAASANRLSLTERGFRVVWTPMTVGLQEVGGEGPPIQIACNVTMEGSFHSRTIVKTPGALIGHLTRFTIDGRNCTEPDNMGGAYAFTGETLPWHITYSSFSGTLPNMSAVRIFFVGMGIVIQRLPIDCRTRSTTLAPAGWRLTRDLRTSAITSLTADESIILPAPTGTLCEGRSIFYSGAGRYTRLGSTSTVSLSLI
jgi:hypothetical protein